MMRIIVFISLLVGCSESYRNDRQYQQVDSTQSGIKSYGGYFPDAAGHNQAASSFVNNRNYQQPAVTSYQPYGWNLNQPSRTYGGVNYLQSRVDDNNFASSGASNNIGWSGNNNNYHNMQANPLFPRIPQVPFFQFPQFPQFPQIQFPNFAPYPNVYNSQPNYHQQGQAPYPQQPLHPMPQLPTDVNYPTRPIDNIPNRGQQPSSGGNQDGTQQTTSTLDQRLGNKGGQNHFPTDSFFTGNQDRDWNEDAEAQWQATTKAPFFENTVPGLGCTLPAASILGARDVFSAIELLPLSIPSGKPILSCNATDLKQTQVKVDDKIYSCKDGIINVECIENGQNSCFGKILVCDMGSSQSLTCTNGTLISSQNLECASISLGNPKSTLNCGYKTSVEIQNRIPVSTTRAPIRLPTRRPSTPAPVFEEDNEQEIQKVDRIDTISDNDDENGLMPQVKKSLENVFPHDLLVKPAETLQPPKPYLPPYETQASRDLKESMNGIFPMDLLAISRGTNSGPNSFDPRLSVTSSSSGSRQASVGGHQQTNWNVETGSSMDGIGFKTHLSSSGIDTRFGGNTQPQSNFQQQQDFRDRLIFSN